MKIVLYSKKEAIICYNRVMDIVISHKSALEYWRMHGQAETGTAARQRRKTLPFSIPGIADISGAIPAGLSFPVDLMVGSPNGKRISSKVRPHVYAGPTPEWGFVGIGRGVVVSAPTLCFFQMAGELPLVKLIELGFELCGSYSLHNGNMRDGEQDPGVGAEYGGACAGGDSRLYINEYGNIRKNVIRSKVGTERAGGFAGGYGGTQGVEYNRAGGNINGTESVGGNLELEAADKTLYNRPQLTSTKALNGFSAKMKGINGQVKACRALRFIADGSASPMETILVMLLTLPHKLGGYGLPMPELNKRIDIRRDAAYNFHDPKSVQRTDKSCYKCDLYWPEVDLAVEYDSDSYHTGSERIAGDAKKRLDLHTLGIEVLTTTRGQIQSVTEFDRLAKAIAKKLEKRLRYENPQFMDARRELREYLL